jgi:ribosomal protein S18 acetylase RimI-like enzyme
VQRLFPQLISSAPCPDSMALNRIVGAATSSLLIVREPDAAGEIVAMGSLAVFEVPTGVHGMIEDLVVDDTYRGKGIGEALVRQLVELARLKGARDVSLTSNPRRLAANRLYLRLGFRHWRTNHYYLSLA